MKFVKAVLFSLLVIFFSACDNTETITQEQLVTDVLFSSSAMLKADILTKIKLPSHKAFAPPIEIIKDNIEVIGDYTIESINFPEFSITGEVNIKYTDFVIKGHTLNGTLEQNFKCMRLKDGIITLTLTVNGEIDIAGEHSGNIKFTGESIGKISIQPQPISNLPVQKSGFEILIIITGDSYSYNKLSGNVSFNGEVVIIK